MYRHDLGVDAVTAIEYTKDGGFTHDYSFLAHPRYQEWVYGQSKIIGLKLARTG